MHTFVTGFQKTKPLFCQPADVTLEQMRRVWIKWGNDHPQELHNTARVLVTIALTEAFPCPPR